MLIVFVESNPLSPPPRPSPIGALDDDFGSDGAPARGGLLSSSDDDGSGGGSDDDDDDDDASLPSASASDSDAPELDIERKSRLLDARRAADEDAAAAEAREAGAPRGEHGERVPLPVRDDGGDDPKTVRRRIAEVGRVLENFKALGEEGVPRSAYMEVVRQKREGGGW